MTVAEPRITYKPVAKRATLHTDLALTHAIQGVALRDGTGNVFFRDDATGQWMQLFDEDKPRIHLHGQEDLILTAMIADGNLVVKCSKTLVAA